MKEVKELFCWKISNIFTKITKMKMKIMMNY